MGIKIIGGKMIVITGATSGIGREFAYAYAKQGKTLFLTGRNKEQLQFLKEELDTKVYTCQADLSKETDITLLVMAIVETCEELEIFINNAGFGLSGEFTELAIGNQQQIIDVNVKAVVELSHYAANQMKAQGYGKIVNVASIVGIVPTPSMSVYSASKNFVRSFSFSLGYELKNSGVKVCVLSPSTTATNFFDRAGSKKTLSKLAMSPKRVAQIATIGIERNQREIIPGILNQQITRSLKLLPLAVAMPIMYNALNQKSKKKTK